MTTEKKLQDFGGELAAEFSDVEGCPGEAGYHCSCYDHGNSCCICNQTPTPNYYRGPVRKPTNFDTHLVDPDSIKD